jgi:hypothetical protein
MEFEDEETWLRHRLRRLRAALRIATEPRVVAILRDLNIDADKRCLKPTAPKRHEGAIFQLSIGQKSVLLSPCLFSFKKNTPHAPHEGEIN